MYSLIAIDTTVAPDGTDSRDWCRYIIARDGSMIVGQCRGTVQQVTQHARSYVDELNARAKGHARPYRYAPDTGSLREGRNPLRSKDRRLKATYNLISVDPTAAPEGIDARHWCRYIIARDASTVVGYRRGTAQQVTQHARYCVEELNARANGRVQSYRSRSPQLRPQASTKK